MSLIAIYQFASGALWLLGALAITVFGVLPVVVEVDDPVGLGVALVVLSLGIVLSGAVGIARLVVGFGLLRMRNWARWAAVVLAGLGLPVGAELSHPLPSLPACLSALDASTSIPNTTAPKYAPAQNAPMSHAQ